MGRVDVRGYVVAATLSVLLASLAPPASACGWFFADDARPRVRTIALSEHPTLDHESRLAIGRVLGDSNLAMPDRVARAIDVWTEARLRKFDAHDPVLAKIRADLVVRYHEDGGEARASSRGLRWPESLSTPTLVVALYAHALERNLQFYEFFGLGVDGLPRDQARRDAFIDLVDIATERELERGGLFAEWEVINAAPDTARIADVRAIEDSALGDFMRGRYAFMLMLGGLPFSKYLDLQYKSGRGSVGEVFWHTVRNWRRALHQTFASE